MALNHVRVHVIAKKNRLRSAENVTFSLLCILVDRSMGGGGVEPPNPPTYVLEPHILKKCNFKSNTRAESFMKLLNRETIRFIKQKQPAFLILSKENFMHKIKLLYRLQTLQITNRFRANLALHLFSELIYALHYTLVLFFPAI